MTLDEQISLIDAMIKENADYTIRDFLDLMKDLQSIAASVPVSTEKIKSINFYEYRKTPTTLRFYRR